jgi:hypothetical protein
VCVGYHDNEPFGILHKQIFDTIEEWVTKIEVLSNSQWIMWKKWHYAGLLAYQSAQRIKHIMDVTNLYQYVAKMKSFPCVILKMHITLNETEGWVHYNVKHNMENLTFQHVQNLINEFHHFTQSYQVKINKLKDQLTTA